MALLIRGAEQLDVELTEENINQIAIYLEELKRWAKIADLVSQSDPETIIRKHILDSLAIITFLPLHGRLIDLGSGAGFPGLPIAIANSALSATLLEPRRKRVNFLKEVIRKTSLTNAQAYEGRAEEFVHRDGWRSAFDIVITRATWNICEFLIVASPFITQDGIIVAMKGAKAEEEVKSSLRELATTGLAIKATHKYLLPYGNEERRIFVFTKKSST